MPDTPRRGVGHPLGVVQIPVDGLHDAVFKSRFRIPAQLRPDFRRVDAVAPVVAQAVLHVADEPQVDFTVPRPPAQMGDDSLHDKEIGALVVAAHDVMLSTQYSQTLLRFYFTMLFPMRLPAKRAQTWA